MTQICNSINAAALRRGCALFGLISISFVWFGTVTAAQTTNSASPYTPEADSDSTARVSDAGSDSNSTGNSTGRSDSNLVLSPSQILAIMQQDPEVTIELKSLLADASQQKGTPLQPDAITDEMLYTQIISSSDLRANITAFLRARGYISETEMQRGGSYLDAGQTVTGPLEPQPTSELPLVEPSNQLLMQPGAARSEITLPNAERVAGLSKEPQGATRQQAKNEKNVRTITDEPQVLRRPTPYNLQSLRDLYVQIPTYGEPLKRFGSDVFVNRDLASSSRAGLSSSAPPLEIPVRPDYVVGPGDSLTINLWGGVTESLNRVIDREGRVMLPETGEVQVAGLKLDSAQAVIEGALKPQFRNAHVAVTVSRLRTVRIYVVGDVQRPGA